MSQRNKQGEFSKKKNLEKNQRIQGLVFHRSGLQSDHHDIPPFDSVHCQNLEPDHHDIPSFDSVHCQNLEPDHHNIPSFDSVHCQNLELDHHDIPSFDSVHCQNLEPDHHDIPSFDSVHCQNLEPDHHNIPSFDSVHCQNLELDHHDIPSFDSVHCQNLEPDHSYAQLKTIETSDLCNVAFESVPDIQDHEVVVDDEYNINVDFDLLPLPTDLLPLNHCRYVVELDYIVQQLKQCSKCEVPLQLHNSLGVKPYGVAGMIHAGIGETQLNNLLAAMDVHCPHHKSLKSREIEVGDIIECQANASERKFFLVDEAFQSMTIDAESNEQAGINASTDTCWQKKGSGRACNSLSGTAKGMEPDMVVQLVKDVHEQNIEINELAGDDDSVGFDRAKKPLPNSKMVKTSDRNQRLIINITKKLYSLKPKQKELTPMVINAITKNYSYMLAQNQGSPEKIEKGVRGMIDHMYGKHQTCDMKWCGYRKDRASYRHTNLPFGKDLTSESL
ncbi:unnamed protein product [Mytilus coruscus]|uniref:Mutator-like transposase domain-containing protein n=1 Tax=Mytilus coruscus TaxID=42192 RepID=A0A6J8BAU9_MYTCO|nr:unnamed protein product [Mytilus coruscus]